MSFHIYYHNLVGGGISCGNEKNGERGYERGVEKYKMERITSFIAITLDDGIEISWDEVDNAIDEAFKEGFKPNLNQVYEKRTSKATVELLAESGFGEDAEDLKDALRDAYNFLTNRGKALDIR